MPARTTRGQRIPGWARLALGHYPALSAGPLASHPGSLPAARSAASQRAEQLILAIGAATLFVKQHYLADLPAGVLLGVLAYWLALPAAAPGRLGRSKS